jgi:hypothetical protein
MWRKVFEPKREEVRGEVGCSKLHNEELHEILSSPDIRVIKAR